MASPAPALFDPAVANDPYPFYALLRREAPVAPLGALGLWGVARYEDVVRVLRDPETFSSVVGERRIAGEELPPSMLFNDPPVHTRLRGLIAKAFTPRVVELQRAAIERRSRELVEAMLAKAEPDIVLDLAYPLPVMVISHMLGVADGDHATFKRWSDAIIENVAPILLTGDDSALTEVNKEFDAYFSKRLAKLRREPEDDLLSELVHVETEQGRLTELELLMFCRLLLVAGNETTTGLIVNAIRAFSEYPGVLAQVRDDPSLLPAAIEEALRYYAPFQATFRRATRDVLLGGQTIPAGARLLVFLASANRDETVFPRPDEFLLDRPHNRHVAFGMGIHYCVGAPLARLEAEVALGELLPRISGVEIDATQDAALLRPGGPKSLRVRFTATDRPRP
ncbi:MAG: cytochrome P450 [Thermodesulfobacteriota bacterium]